MGLSRAGGAERVEPGGQGAVAGGRAADRVEEGGAGLGGHAGQVEQVLEQVGHPAQRAGGSTRKLGGQFLLRPDPREGGALQVGRQPGDARVHGARGVHR